MAVGFGLGLDDADADGEAVVLGFGLAVGLAAGTILAEVWAVLVALADAEGAWG